MLMHASVNNTTGIVPAAVPHAVDPMSLQGSLVAWVSVVVSWMIALLLISDAWGRDRRDAELRVTPALAW